MLGYGVSADLVDAGEGILWRAFGRVPGDELAGAFSRLIHDQRRAVEGARYWVSDYTGLDGSDVLAGHARRIADDALSVRNAGLLMAQLCPTDLEFGMTRMWEALAADTGWIMGVFRTPPDLEAWLNERLEYVPQLARGANLVQVGDLPGHWPVTGARSP